VPIGGSPAARRGRSALRMSQDFRKTLGWYPHLKRPLRALSGPLRIRYGHSGVRSAPRKYPLGQWEPKLPNCRPETPVDYPVVGPIPTHASNGLSKIQTSGFPEVQKPLAGAGAGAGLSTSGVSILFKRCLRTARPWPLRGRISRHPGDGVLREFSGSAAVDAVAVDDDRGFRLRRE
jgi:hypothetical protein